MYRLALHEREEGEDVLRLITGTQDATFEQLEARQVRFKSIRRLGKNCDRTETADGICCKKISCGYAGDLFSMSASREQ